MWKKHDEKQLTVSDSPAAEDVELAGIEDGEAHL